MAKTTVTVEVPASTVKLTIRERAILVLIAQGFASKEVADKLFISKRTVDFHLANVYDKLTVCNRMQAVVTATRLNLLSA